MNAGLRVNPRCHHLLACWLIALAAALTGCASAARTAPIQGRLSPDRCLLVDTDAALDDIRAIAALARNRRITAVIVTEGIATPRRGAMAVAHLLAADRSLSIPIVIGSVAATHFSEPWLSDVRANAERLNGFLSEAVALPSGTRPVDNDVSLWTRECTDVRVVVLGPWTSFVLYAPALGTKLHQVVAQGIPLEDVPSGTPPGFNCRYDMEACRQANQRRRPSSDDIWVDVPRDVAPPDDYAPTAEMIGALTVDGLPGILRVLLRANPGGWQGTLMSDDSVAVYVLHPEAFGAKAHHVEPTVSAAEIRALWLSAVNNAS